MTTVLDPVLDPAVEDDVLRLMFTALTLKMIGGLSTEEIARAFLVPVATMAARITRAKKALAAVKVPFEVPVGDELAPRLASVLEVVYLVFNEGYAATSGSSWTRPVLCDEAMRLGRILAGLAPAEPEAHGLVAEDVPALRRYHLVPAVRGDLLDKLGRPDEACQEFTRAAELAGNEQERAVLLARAEALRPS